MERFQNIKNGINSAQNIRLVFPENPDNDILGAVLALNSVFRQLNKKVYLPTERLPQKIGGFGDGSKKRIAITLNEDIDEIYYEKKRGHVDLNIIPKNNNFDTKNFSWELIADGKEKPNTMDGSPDLIVIVGIARFSEIEEFLPTDEEELFACTIVNIDKNPLNENYGDINIVEKGLLSKIVSFLVKEMKDSDFKKDVFDFLLFGFFSQKHISIKDVSAIKWLIGNGGTFDAYFEYKKQPKPIWAKYLELAVKNIFLQEDKEIIFSYLSINNGNEEEIKNILQVSKIFREWINPNAFFLSFKDGSITKTIFYSIDKSIVNRIKSEFEGNFKENGGIIATKKEPRETMEELKEISF
ncbi:MAG: hypothetical protein WCX74_00415 [Candidatus Paceibacterota bacterium]